MADDDRTTVSKEHRAAQDKYTYFLLAAVGAAVAFALSQTRDSALVLSHALLGVALAFWALSFICGCRQLQYVQSNLYANGELLSIKSGLHPEVPAHPDYIRAASEGIRDAMMGNARRAAWSSGWQFRSFVAGAMLYITWHILQMFARSAGG
jgi:hypothetical protein